MWKSILAETFPSILRVFNEKQNNDQCLDNHAIKRRIQMKMRD
ncbi:hypothetical protein [Virgibacillus sp. SK37]|nr:hypothetical protein [Virgibacillus sp. SK37]